MIKAKKPSQTRILYRGKQYKLFETLENKSWAETDARYYRTAPGRFTRDNYTNSIVVDLGKEAGRLRYGVFIAKGRKIPKRLKEWGGL